MGTKERILAAAERLFAERGYDATSLRAITAAAGVNLAAVNYHFSSKEALLQQLFSRRLSLLNRERLALLDAFEAEAHGRPVPVEKLIQAFLEPLFRAALGPPDGSKAFAILLGRMYFSPSSFHVQAVASEIREISGRFIAAFCKTLPGLPASDLAWRIHFIIGAMGPALSGIGVLKIISQGNCDPSDLNEAYRRLLTFVAAGIQAPAQPEPEIRKGHHPAPAAVRAGVNSRRRTSQPIQKQR
jgi:AcrR family transcriptional regulator